MGCEALAAAGLGEARAVVAARAVDCVLLDIRLRDGDGLDYLGELRATARGVPVIVATAYGDSERTIRAMRDGAFDYLTKPFDLAALRATIERALNQRALAREAGPAPDPPEARQDLVGTSAAMLAIWKLIGRAAASTAPVLITGETGTGKELVARAIHAYSPRARGPFVAVNLAALPPTLIESELFGHERGRVHRRRPRAGAGRFEAAAGGTLFLDEIGDLDPALQTKLLRVVQEGTYERVGGNDPLTSDARLIAATNRPVRPGARRRAPCARSSTTGWRSSRSSCRRCARAAATSRCWSRTRCAASRRAPSRRRRCSASRRAPGPATCASCSTSSSARPCCAAAR